MNVQPTLDPNLLAQQVTRLLIVDYDVCRYHSFDLFRYSLLNWDMFQSLRPEYLNMLRLYREIADQVDCYRSTCVSINPFDNFDIDHPEGHRFLEQKLCEMFKDEQSKVTPTDVGSRFDIVFNAQKMVGFLMRYKDDPYQSEFELSNLVTVFNEQSVLDPNRVAELIITNNINAVMISSVDMAILVAGRLVNSGYKSPMTFILGTYHYNYEPVLSGEVTMATMKHAREMYILETELRYEFGVFDPYSGLSYRNKITQNEE